MTRQQLGVQADKSLRFSSVACLWLGIRECQSVVSDPYSRPQEKRGSAWTDECVGRSVDPASQSVQLPVAYLCCNQSPPSAALGNKPAVPSLMSFREVETLPRVWTRAAGVLPQKDSFVCNGRVVSGVRCVMSSAC